MSLWLSETRLRAAFDALGAVDPESTMTPAEAELFLASFVDRDAAIERRDEFAEFLREGEALVEAKQARAVQLSSEAVVLRNGLERMKGSALAIMERNAVEELRGRTYTLTIKRSRGRCVVIREEDVPAEFKRTAGDRDLEIIARLAELVPDAHREEAEALLAEASSSRTAVDKRKIQDVWKAAGGKDRIDHEDGTAELLVPGAVKEVDVELLIK